MTAMKKGKYFRIPEVAADMERLWYESEPIESAQRLGWLLPEDSSSYRYAGSVSCSWPYPLTHEQRVFFNELEELQAAGLIVAQDPHDRPTRRLYVKKPENEIIWSIGIYVGHSPFSFRSPSSIKNPVITREDVSDVSAALVADPFLLHEHNTWYLFFEVMNGRAGKGEIGLAISEDGLSWRYQEIVLAEPFHLSYPYVFKIMNDYFMIPESHQAGSIRLYKALEFPARWSFVGALLEGPYFADASVFRHGGKWWLFADTSPGINHDTLRLYYADDLMGPWLEHCKSPIIAGDARNARPAGRVLVESDRIVRYTQNCVPYYGTEVRAFEITKLTTADYHEREIDQNPVLTFSGIGWNACGMHHIDPHFIDNKHWIASVDGWFNEEIVRERNLASACPVRPIQ
jgi:hypothetical protein